MQYRGALEIPAGTSQSDPTILVLPVCYGLLTQYSLHFPPGQAGTTYVQVYYRGRQILPTTMGASFRGDDTFIVSPEAYPLYDSPFFLELVGWAPAASYDHTVYCQFYIEPSGLTVPTPVLPVALPE